MLVKTLEILDCKSWIVSLLWSINVLTMKNYFLFFLQFLWEIDQ